MPRLLAVAVAICLCVPVSRVMAQEAQTGTAVPSGEAPAEAPPAEVAAPAVPDELPPGPVNRLYQPFKDAGVNGYAAFSYFSSDKFLNNQHNFPGLNLMLKSHPSFGKYAGLYVEARAMAQSLNHDAQSTNNRTLAVTAPAIFELREGYVEVFAGDLEIRAGKQITVWGRADEINPTDWLSARNLTLLFPDPFEQRTGVVSLKADYFLPMKFRLTAAWQPVPTASTIPLPKTVPVPPGSPPISFNEVIPDVALSNGEYAVKLDNSGGAVDWSVSYFNGFNRTPEVRPGAVSPTGVELILGHSRMQGVGADFATAVGGWGLRGEASYNRTRNPDGKVRDIQTPYLFYVLGLERTLGENFNIIAQYYGRYVFNRYPLSVITGSPMDPVLNQIATYNALFTSQLDTVQNGVSVRASKKFWNDTLETELAYAFNFEHHDWMIRPKGSYAVTDDWKVTVGGEIYRGPRISQFGFLRKNSTGYLEIRRSF